MFIPAQTVDNLAILDVAAVNLALTGAFDDRIKELKELLKKQQERDYIVTTLLEVDKLKESAQTEMKGIFQRERDIQAQSDSLNVRENALREERKNLDVSRTELAAGQIGHAKERETFNAMLQRSNNELNSNREWINTAKEKIQSDLAALAEQKSEFNAKLTALKA